MSVQDLPATAIGPFLPPFPARPPQALPPLKLLATARRNFLAIFEEKAFEYQFFSSRVLNRRSRAAFTSLRKYPDLTRTVIAISNGTYCGRSISTSWPAIRKGSR